MNITRIIIQIVKQKEKVGILMKKLSKNKAKVKKIKKGHSVLKITHLIILISATIQILRKFLKTQRMVKTLIYFQLQINNI